MLYKQWIGYHKSIPVGASSTDETGRNHQKGYVVDYITYVDKSQRGRDPVRMENMWDCLKRNVVANLYLVLMVCKIVIKLCKICLQQIFKFGEHCFGAKYLRHLKDNRKSIGIFREMPQEADIHRTLSAICSSTKIKKLKGMCSSKFICRVLKEGSAHIYGKKILVLWYRNVLFPNMSVWNH